MKDKLIEIYHEIGFPRIIISLFLILIWVVAIVLKIPFFDLLYDCIIRTSMWIILTLALMPGILAGTGLNFGLPIGILAGLLGMVFSIESNFKGLMGFLMSIIYSIPIAVIFGYLYGLLLNKVKGSEMMVSTYAGFAMVSLLSIGWLILPLKAPEMAWPIGVGLRVTISLSDRFSQILNNFLLIKINNLKIPLGFILFVIIFCVLTKLFFKTKTGISIIAAGDNPRFAETCGISVDKSRLIGTILSNVLGAIGIIVYAQSFGFIQLYQAPLMMGFTAVACILIGGATIKKATILNVIIGTFLFQSILVSSMPVANIIAKNFSNVAEIARLIIQNGIILYALAQKEG